MQLLLFGATGMVGEAALRAALADPAVERVVLIGRRTSGHQHAKIVERIAPDLHDLSTFTADFAASDGCIFALGVASAGMDEASYTRITRDIAVHAAELLFSRHPDARFVFVSGRAADSSEQGSVMWARVKGRAENDLLRLAPGRVSVVRPGVIEPLDGIVSRTRLYRMLYAVMRPLMPLLRVALKRSMTNTRDLGRVLVHLARETATPPILEDVDLVSLATRLRSRAGGR
jgi:uncharacterized protein YbjT (DUF2867 family)